MLKLLRTIAEDDAAVKSLFDHVRNLGIAAAVLGAALWKFRNAEPQIFYFEMFIVALLAGLGAFLFFVNQFHGIRKLRSAGYPAWVYHLVLHTYSLVAVTIILALAWRY
ncbi:MAG: hypothetical protein KF755_05165 [Burkholderiaceae bacterium]|nr:hypothetical protein [Burkholderiaceae bacterium]